MNAEGKRSVVENQKVGLDIAIKQLEAERARRESLDTKSSLIIGFAGALLGILFNVIPKNAPASSIPFSNPTLVLLIAVGVVSAFVSAFLSLLSVRVQSEWSGPEDKILLRAVEHFSTQQFYDKLIPAYARAYMYNGDRNRHKAQFIRFALAFLVASSAAISASIILYLWLIK